MTTKNYSKSNQIPLKNISVTDTFWKRKLKLNNSTAIFYQWEQLEKTHNQDNFRVLAGEKEGYRFGFFYSDSDLHKWSDAAARILVNNENKALSKLVREYIDLMTKAQTPDGYLFTYNQFHFPNKKWVNLQIEHELYCLGHMLEAAISYMGTNEPVGYKKKFLNIATKAADLIVHDFLNKPPRFTPGHQEIEIALIKLYRLTNERKYLEMASQFIYNRGKIPFFGLKLMKQAANQKKREKIIQKDMLEKNINKDQKLIFFKGETKQQKEAPFLSLRSTFQFLTGRYHQQNQPVVKMKRPFGHSVRWGYLATAMAMLYQENGDKRLLTALEQTWQHLIKKQMFFTGGIGALGIVEGFGRDYELDGSYCYCETCAAIANILLNWELALITGQAKYSDLLEWQLYNALNVGIALDGKSYLYRNLLEADHNLTRKDWFACPCCPSNVSRIWATIGQYIYSFNENNIWVHQFFGNETTINLNGEDVQLKMSSQLPWENEVNISFSLLKPTTFSLHLRIPSWTKKPEMKINGKIHRISMNERESEITGSGFNPNASAFYTINRTWEKENSIEITFPMEITIHKAHPKVKSTREKIALSRGPITFCLESIDNPNSQIPNETIDLHQEIKAYYKEDLFEGVYILQARNKKGEKLIGLPYYCWANRERSAIQVWIKA